MIIPDVNILVYAHSRGSIFFERANEWWKELLFNPNETILLPWVVVSGFLRATGSRALVHPISLSASLEIVEQWLSFPTVSIIEPGDHHIQLIRQLSEQSQMQSSKLTDIQIAALAIEHRATVATHDRDFLRFSGMRVIFPLE